MANFIRMDRSFSQCMALAKDYAFSTEQDLGSVHIFLSIFAFDNPAKELLRRWNIDEDRFIDAIDKIKPEKPGLMKRIFSFLCSSVEPGKEIITAGHLISSILKIRDCQAYRVMLSLGAPIAEIRQKLKYSNTGKIPFDETEVLTERRFEQICKRSLAGIEEAFTDPEIDLDENSKDDEPIERQTLVKDIQPPDFSLSKNDQKPLGEWHLDSDRFSILTSIGKNLCELASESKVPEVYGRKFEIAKVLEIVGKMHSNNPILVGEPGVGKTSIVEGLANLIVNRDIAKGSPLDGKIIVEISIGSLLSGTGVRGSLSKRISNLKEEVKDSNGKVIVFIDEIHMLLSAEDSESSQQISGELKSALARGEFPCIGATTSDEYQKYFSKDPALSRRFSMIRVEEPKGEDLLNILCQSIQRYESWHGVSYSKEIIKEAADLTGRYIHDRRQPDKSFSVLDLAGSLAKNAGESEVSKATLAAAVSSLSQVSVDFILKSDMDRILGLNSRIKENIIGQDQAVDKITSLVKRSYAGLRKRPNLGAFLFFGPSGVGKTQMCKELARNLFGSEDFLVKLDMSEYSSEAAVFKLIGAPAGHVGYEDGGLLTNAVRKKPFSVVLFDELEKAHDKVRKCLLQILESGQITDSKGSAVSFASAFIVATTNLGRDELLSGDKKKTIGFASEKMESHSGSEINREILEELSPELTNRFQGVIPFMPIEKVNLKRIVFMEATKILNAFAERIESNFVLSDLLIDHIVDRMDYQAELGARQVARYVQEMIEDPLLDRFYLGEMHQGRKYTISVESNEIQLTDLTA